MIYNRTETDVTRANILRKKIQSGQSLNAAETAAFERGSCTINMLNRIESKQAELAEVLNSIAYRVNISNRQWTAEDIFEYADYLRILGNLDKLKQAFFVYSSTPAMPSYMYGYKEANDIEKILVDIEEMIGVVESKFRECGTFQCGEANDL